MSVADGRRRYAAAALLIVGLSQMAADAAGCASLKGLAAATMLAPAPKVFSSVKGYETFSTKFIIEGENATGATSRSTITPERYAGVIGPYQRRNIYGAALAYGPVLPASLQMPVMQYALCGDAPLIKELGLDPSAFTSRVRVRFVARAGTDLDALGLPSVLIAPCVGSQP